MKSFRKSSSILRLSADMIIIILLFIIIGIITQHNEFFFIRVPTYFILLLLLITWGFSSISMGLNDEFRARSFSFEFIALLKCVGIQAIALIILTFIFQEIQISRIFYIIYPISLLVIISLEKFFVRKILEKLRQNGRNLRHLLIVGGGEVGSDFCSIIKENPHFGYNLLGFIDDDTKKNSNNLYLGNIASLEQILATIPVDDVIVALPTYATEKIDWVINSCEKHPIRVKIIPDYFRFIAGSKYSISMFGRFPIITIREDRIGEYHWRIVKRGFDTLFVIAFVFGAFLWLYPLLAILIKLTSKGPIMYKQERWGRKNKRFTIYKFRTMDSSSKDIDENGKYRSTMKNDPRVTWIGNFLRKSNLDELPQIINVLKGEMSLVGPRPHPTPLNIEVKEQIRQYSLRHLVKPGITGWAQVNGLRGGGIEKTSMMENRVNYDLWYIENWSLSLDIQIILMTIWKMIKGDPHAF